jgi:hypothetical protein
MLLLIEYNRPRKKANPVIIPAITPHTIPLGADTLALVVSSEVYDPASYPDIPYKLVNNPITHT